MQYQFNERYEQVRTITFLNSSPLVNVDRIRYFKEHDVTGTFTKKEFRYSFDNATWTNWNTLTQGNLSSIQFRDEPNFYLEVVYHRTGIATGNIGSWYLFYDSGTPTPPVPPPDASIDADTLQGEGPAYYLDRTNHTGPYTDLNVSNVVDGSTIGVYSHRVDTSLGTEFFFKRIEGRGGVTVTEETGGKIVIDASIGGGGDAYVNDDLTVVSVGGIDQDSSFFYTPGKTFEQTMDAMFYPVQYPTLTAPSNGFSDDAATYIEIGSLISIGYTATFNRGSINPQYDASSAYRSGPANTYHYNLIGDIRNIAETSPSNIQTLSNHTVTQGIQTSTSNVSYDEGVQPYDSVGNLYNSPWPEGSTGVLSLTFEGVYPLYGTTVDISTYTKRTPLSSMIGGNNITFDLVSEILPDRQGFDVPDVWLVARPLAGIDYNDPILGWQPLNLSNWPDSSTSHLIQGNIVNYTRYNWNGVAVGAREIRIKF